MNINKLLLILISCLVLSACQSIKNGLSGAKSENSDEFLVQKKNPLTLPPKYLELPRPKDLTTENEEAFLNQDSLDIKKMLGIEEQAKDLPSPQSGEAEDFVLRNIKNN
tara:strand:+ start:221 stop:547 length:327 start_codon:yes stop_codon:yes gene_type:complete